LELLKKLKTKYERTDVLSDKVKLNRVNNAVKYFENQLNELDRKASFASVPRNWRE
jgi:hypothetical protein